jgi:DNA-binding NarL/FixJ family response regulator
MTDAEDFVLLSFITSEVHKMANLLDLTSREREILQLVLAGRPNKAIAAEFRVTEKTVAFHLDHIYTRIGIRTRLMACIWALQQSIEAETREIPS